ncbi:hypothetical protein ACFFWD_25530, partial [Bradyrhizobium erythrophlei]|uniref:hypothetical protein n=1 Tax=Bradyrhizobium erythrophlei TaxID=1437360 RepID=UPI0035E73368
RPHRRAARSGLGARGRHWTELTVAQLRGDRWSGVEAAHSFLKKENWGVVANGPDAINVSTHNYWTGGGAQLLFFATRMQ